MENKKIKKILFIAPLRKDRAPSQRFRFEQYLDYIKQNGFEYTFSNLITVENDKIFYAKGKVIQKIYLLIKFYFQRLYDVWRSKNYDLVFIQREAYYFGTSFFEKMFAKRSNLIFDFDDSIWLPNVSDANKNFNWLKNPNKTAEIIGYSKMIFAGNKYLHDYAKQFNNNVRIIPTTIDTDEYKRINIEDKDSRICIGWSGSITTIQHFNFAVPFLKVIKERYNDKVYFKVIGDGNYINKELDITGLPWIKEDEIKEFSSMDIGIMPLPDDEWAKGKCGLKGIQYMAMEIPTIMSPVGVNNDIIEQGVNGFLATTVDEWADCLSKLIESKELRETIATNGRNTVVDKYSVSSQKDIYVKLFNEVCIA